MAGGAVDLVKLLAGVGGFVLGEKGKGEGDEEREELHGRRKRCVRDRKGYLGETGILQKFSAKIAALLGGGRDELAVDDDVGGVSSGLEGVAIEKGEVGVLADFERADLVIEAKNLGRIDGAGGEGDFLWEAVGGGEGGLEVDDAGFGDVGLVAGLEGEGDAFFMELGGESEGHVFEIAEGAAHGGVDDDGDIGGFNFVEEEVGFGGPIEDEIEAELLAKAEGGGDVLMALGIDEERGLFVEDVDESEELDVSIRGVFFVIFLGGGDLVRVCLGFEEFGAKEGDGLGAGAG